jgi:hypothetical protein
MVIRVAVMLALAGGVFSCGGDGSDAPMKCDALVSRICARVIACVNDGTTEGECEAAAKTVLPCARAVAVSTGYDSCVAEVQTSPCSVLVNTDMLALPPTCHASIFLPQ